MGCGASSSKLEIEELIDQRNRLARKSTEFRMNELAVEIQKAEKELEVQKNEYKRLLHQQDLQHESNRRKSLSKLQDQREETDRARVDAEKMRKTVIKMEDTVEDNKRLSRERNRIAYELEQAKEELRLTLIIFNGQKELLELEKTRVENLSEQKIHKEEEKFKEKARQLNELVRAAENKVELAERDARVQRKAAIAVMRSGSFPHGTGGLDGTVTTAVTAHGN